MLAFVGPDTDLSLALVGAYDGNLVFASYAFAAVAAYAGLMIAERMAVAVRTRVRWAWIAAGSIVMGFGIWTMHFIGMIAFVLPLPMGYDVTITLVSLIPAVLASGGALHVMAARRHGWQSHVVAGTLIGAGIGLMHYTGMAAMRMHATLLYDPGLFALSILVAALLGIAALYANDVKLDFLGKAARSLRRPLAAALMGLAISAMHYTAMQATHFMPLDLPMGHQHDAMEHDWLIAAVAAAAGFLTLLAITAAVFASKLSSVSLMAQVSRQQMMAAIEHTSDGILMFDAGGRLVMCNKMFRDMHPALRPHTQPGTPYERLLTAWANIGNEFSDPGSRAAYIARCLAHFREGAPMSGDPQEERLDDGRWMYIRQTPIEDVGIIGVWTDVTPIKSMQALYEKEARHDTLTGLANRKLFNERLQRAAGRADRLKIPAALLYVDLDRFKPINDTYGHEAGDAVLKEVARRLSRVGREADTVARLGGDEFAVIMEPPADQAAAKAVAKRILDMLAAPISFEGNLFIVGATIGIALSPAGAFDVADLLRRADNIMYKAKEDGRGIYRVAANSALPPVA